mmetsp:Transcript_18348/g.25883  ORF Transcript_18348/g.25883 Transcript_18348/m.25883 type:complete len:216 (-) Transcript_18348:123-770(-)
MMKSFSSLVALLCLLVVSTTSYSFNAPTRRSVMTMKRGRGSFKKEAGGGGSASNVKPMAGGLSSDATAAAPKGRWVPVQGIKSMKELPQEEGSVQLVDTMADVLVNGATNPTGAVAVVKYEGSTYCFSSSCSKCKIPLTKAKVLPGNDETGNVPRLQCDFCQAAYNIRTGEPVASEGGGGLFSGVAKAVFSSQDAVPLPTYSLGEQNGKVLINLR